MNDSSDIFSTPKIIVVMVDAEKVNKVIGFHQREHTPLLYRFQAHGETASGIPGLCGSGKTVLISIAPDFYVNQLMKGMSIELEFDQHPGEVAFSMPLAGIAGRGMAVLINDIDTSTEHVAEKEVGRMNNKIEHDLLIVAAKRGYCEEIIESAKSAGATGGTVWDAEKIDLKDSVKVVDVTLQSEQEIIAMVVERNKKRDIMMTINSKFGIESAAQGLVLALPVDSVYGLGRDT